MSDGTMLISEAVSMVSGGYARTEDPDDSSAPS